MAGRSLGRLQMPRHWVAAVLIFAILLRVVGIGFGQPFWLANDELALVGGAMRMLELRNPIPSLNPGPMSILYYPPGLPWLYLVVWAPILSVQWLLSGFLPLQAFADKILTDFTPIWVASRLVSAAFSVATVWVVMRITAEVLKNRASGLIAGLLLATSFHHGLMGHFARVWSPTVFFFWWGFWVGWRIYEDGRWRDYVWAATAAGIGFAVNYVGVLISLAVAVAHIARHRRIVFDRPIFIHAAIVAVLIAVFSAVYWQNILRLMGFSGLLAGVGGARDMHGTVETAYLLKYYAMTLIKSDAPLVVVGLVGLPLLVRRAPLFLVLFVAVFVPYSIMILTGYANDDRYILPLTPILAIGGGALATLTWQTLRRAAFSLLVVIIAIQAAALARLEYLMLRPDTRVLARTWIDENVPADEGVISLLRSVTFEQRIDAIRLERDIAPGSLSYLQRRRLAKSRDVAGNAGHQINAVDARKIATEASPKLSGEEIFNRLRAEGYSWFVADDLSGPIGDGRFEALLLAHATLVKTIDPGSDRGGGPIFNMTDQFERGSSFDVFHLHYLGPVVKIYRIE